MTYVAKETPMIMYLNAHGGLETLRRWGSLHAYIQLKIRKGFDFSMTRMCTGMQRLTGSEDRLLWL